MILGIIAALCFSFVVGIFFLADFVLQPGFLIGLFVTACVVGLMLWLEPDPEKKAQKAKEDPHA